MILIPEHVIGLIDVHKNSSFYKICMVACVGGQINYLCNVIALNSFTEKCDCSYKQLPPFPLVYLDQMKEYCGQRQLRFQLDQHIMDFITDVGRRKQILALTPSSGVSSCKFRFSTDFSRKLCHSKPLDLDMLSERLILPRSLKLQIDIF